MLGEHVKPVNVSLTYIVPLCRECNKRTDEITVYKELVRNQIKRGYPPRFILLAIFRVDSRVAAV